MPDPAALAELSDSLFSFAIVAYSVATLAFAAEFAFSVRPARSAADVRESELVSTGVDTGSTGPAPASTVVDDQLTESPAGSRSLRAGRIAFAALVIAALIHGTSILLRGLSAGRMPLGNMFELATMVAFVGVVSFLVIAARQPNLRRIGLFVALPVTLGMFLIGLFLYAESGPLVAALRSKWLLVHVTTVSIGFGGFLTSGITSILFLVRSRYEERLAVRAAAGDAASADTAEMAPVRGAFAARLPSAESLDRAAHRLVVFAFPVFTFAVIFGAIWAESAWGRFWGWDPKETWSFIAWIVYAAYLHARATAGWKGRAAAWINTGGLAVMVFNLLYVNFVSSGLHSYAGVS